eukprot:1546258-Prymnesium_polylepis.1
MLLWALERDGSSFPKLVLYLYSYTIKSVPFALGRSKRTADATRPLSAEPVSTKRVGPLAWGSYFRRWV